MSEKFIPKLVHAIDWAGKISGLTLVIGFVLWQTGALPFIGKIVESEFRKQDLIEQVSENSEFRKCWPVGKCDGIQGLPVDSNQNASIINLAEAVETLNEYVRDNCQTDRDKGDDRYDCTKLFLSLNIYVE